MWICRARFSSIWPQQAKPCVLCRSHSPCSVHVTWSWRLVCPVQGVLVAAMEGFVHGTIVCFILPSLVWNVRFLIFEGLSFVWCANLNSIPSDPTRILSCHDPVYGSIILNGGSWQYQSAILGSFQTMWAKLATQKLMACFENVAHTGCKTRNTRPKIDHWNYLVWGCMPAASYM